MTRNLQGLPSKGSKSTSDSDAEKNRKTILWVQRRLIQEMKNPTEHASGLAQLAISVIRAVELLEKLAVVEAKRLADNPEAPANIEELVADIREAKRQ